LGRYGGQRRGRNGSERSAHMHSPPSIVLTLDYAPLLIISSMPCQHRRCRHSPSHRAERCIRRVLEGG
jgi:hypothetical protein